MALDVMAVLLTNILLKNIRVILQKHKPVTHFRSNCNIPAGADSLSADNSKMGIFRLTAQALREVGAPACADGVRAGRPNARVPQR